MRLSPMVLKRSLALVLTGVLAFSGVPAVAIAEQDDAKDDAANDPTLSAIIASADEATSADTDEDDEWGYDWTEHIDSMLAQGNYTEGEVVATVLHWNDDDGVDTYSAEGRSTAQSLLDGADLLMESDGRALERATDSKLPKDIIDSAATPDTQSISTLSADTQDDDDGDAYTDVLDASNVPLDTVLIKRSDMTTRQLLEALASDYDVLDAEPNFQQVAIPDGESTGTATASEDDTDGNGVAAYAATGADGSFTPSSTAQDVTASADATGYQWAYNPSACAFKKSLAGALATVNYSAWNTGTRNSNGIIAVFDSGIDLTHPDLQGSLATLPANTVSQIGEGTAHGFNAVAPTAEPSDDNGHGTHVAGIIAAQQNGYGISGIACGAKLLAVKAADSRGALTAARIVKGYDYLIKAVEAGVDIRVVNNSWSGGSSNAVDLAVTTLGQHGVVSVFASGNNGRDIEHASVTSTALKNNSYAVVVDSSDAAGTASLFSNRGATVTHLFAPGGAIMSTLRMNTPGKYLASAASGNAAYETFTGAGSVSAYALGNGSEQKVGHVAHSDGFDAQGGCLALTAADLNAAQPSDAFDSYLARIELHIPVDRAKLASISNLGAVVNVTGLASCKAKLQVMDSTGAWIGTSNETDTLDNGNWNALSLDLTAACSGRGGRKKAIALFRDGNGGTYIKACVRLDTRSKPMQATYGLKIDCVGLGHQTWHYGFMSGTSMAAPAVSGICSMLSTTLDGANIADRDAKAQKIAACMRKCTSARTSLAGLCTSGGIVDASRIASTIKADASSYYVGKWGLKLKGDDVLVVAWGTGLTSCISSVIETLGNAVAIRSEDDMMVIKLTVPTKPNDNKPGSSDKPSTNDSDHGNTDNTGDRDDASTDDSTTSNNTRTTTTTTVTKTTKTKRVKKTAATALVDTGDHTFEIIGALVAAGIVLMTIGIIIVRKRR